MPRRGPSPSSSSAVTYVPRTLELAMGRALASDAVFGSGSARRTRRSKVRVRTAGELTELARDVMIRDRVPNIVRLLEARPAIGSGTAEWREPERPIALAAHLQSHTE